MKLGIMQPYFFPYIGYFELIAKTDYWVVFDVVQYNDRSWMNRNRILHPKAGWQYIQVPVAKTPHGTPIHRIRLKDRAAAQTRLLGQLDHYRKHAPYFRQVIDVVHASFAESSDRLVDLNVAGLASVCAYLGLEFRFSLCSETDLDLEGIEHPGQWALRIAEKLGASEYINPPGGRDLFRQSEWEAASIRLRFTEMPSFSYPCGPYPFIDNLSILDVLMWNRPAEIVAAFGGENDAERKSSRPHSSLC